MNCSSAGALLGVRLASRIDSRRLAAAFTGLAVVVGLGTAAQALA